MQRFNEKLLKKVCYAMKVCYTRTIIIHIPINKDPTIVLQIILINSVTFSNIVDCLERGLYIIS